MTTTSPYYLAFLASYSQTSLALFKGSQCLGRVIEDNKKSSKLLIGHLDMLLKQQNITLADCSFLAALQGPAPFTSLRVVIATVNGLAFAAHKPIIGVDGLDAFLQQEADDVYDCTVVLLNAFTDDVYYGIYQAGIGVVAKGCLNIKEFLEIHKINLAGKSIKMVGNSVTMHEINLRETFGDQLHISSCNPEYCSIESVAQAAFEQWQNNVDMTYQLLPLYLKSSSAKLNIK